MAVCLCFCFLGLDQEIEFYSVDRANYGRKMLHFCDDHPSDQELSGISESEADKIEAMKELREDLLKFGFKV